MYCIFSTLPQKARLRGTKNKMQDLLQVADNVIFRYSIENRNGQNNVQTLQCKLKKNYDPKIGI